MFLVLIVAVSLLSQREDQVATQAESAEVVVLRVVDGDTLLLESRERVRLLGIDTPETKIPNVPPEPFGPEASEFTRRAVEGKKVRLEFDVERFDDYGRILAFVFVDDRLLNEQLVASGLARAQPQYPFRGDYKKRLVAAEQHAQQSRLGIWSIEIK